ncbi:MAG TPA: hypothetical protein VF139_09055 [Candidatus Polarisedimenticolaceae bacterium]
MAFLAPCARLAAVVLLAGAAQAQGAGAIDPEAARHAARQFGQSLVASQPASLRSILPEHGNVRLVLARLGPENGSFGASQVEALFRDFLSVGQVRSFEVLRLQSDGTSSALVQGLAVIVDRDGRAGRVALHLAFEPEGSRWVLREVKETIE